MIEISQLDFLSLLIRSSVCGILFGILCEPVGALRLFFALVLRSGNNTRNFWLFKKSITLPHTVGFRKERLANGAAAVFEFVLDVAVVVSAGISMILISYSYNSGRMRWMIPAGFVLGFLAYRITLGKLVKKIVSATVYFLVAVTVKLVGVVIAPIKRIKWKTKNSESVRRMKIEKNKRRTLL